MVSYQCRTCRETNVGQFRLLTDLLDEERCPRKTLADFLWDIAKINNKTEDAKRLPQQICSGCSRKLNNTYSFILQAQVANRKLYASLYIGKAGCSSVNLANKNSDCLLEAPIDIPSMRQTEIKEEIDVAKEEVADSNVDGLLDGQNSGDRMGENATDVANSIKNETIDLDKTEEGDDADSTCTEESIRNDPITTVEAGYKGENAENEVAKSEKNEMGDNTLNDAGENASDNHSDHDNSKSDDTSNAPPIKRRRGRSQAAQSADITYSDNDARYHCNKCNKSFAWKKDAERHLRIHTDIYPYKCEKCNHRFQKKDKYEQHLKLHTKGDDIPIPEITLEEKVNYITIKQELILENQQSILQSIENLKENNLNAFSEIAATLDKLQRNRSVEAEVIFPIKSFEELKSVNELCRDDAAHYIQCIKPIILPEGIGKNFHRLLDREMIQLLNYDGVNNKAAFKDFTFLNSAIFDDEEIDFESKLQVELEENDTSDEESEEEDAEEIKTKRRRGRPLSSKKPEFTFNNDDERYHCNRCNKDFAWKKDVERHIKSHFGIYPYECVKCGHRFQRKDKFADHLKVHAKQEAGIRRPRPAQRAEWNFAEHLYTELRFRSIECKLCDETIPNLSTLRNHLQTHTEPQTIQLDAENDVVKELFPNSKGGINQIKALICKDIKDQHYAKYYAIINAYGYEMALSDSDTESTTDSNKYECELCHIKVARKHQLLQHSKTEHSQEKLPHKCNVCKLEFVSAPMFELHSRTQCRNRNRKYQCIKCPGKFVWLQNLQGHKCSNRLNLYAAPQKSEQRKRNLLQCNFCDKTFRYATDLKRHQETHNLGSRSHVCSICSQPFLKAENLRQHMRQDHDQFKRRIECCLCGEKPKTLAQLRTHLQHHSDGWTGIRYTEGLYFKVHWPQGCKGKEGEVEQSIVIDFAGQNLTPYYSAVDESGNELDLYDSETDLELESGSSTNIQPPPNSYTCDLCGEVFFRRLRILQHQHSAHADGSETLPHACGRCEKQYVSLGLLEQHYKRDCGNIYKRFDCQRCSARFVWEENLKQHMQRQHIDPEQQISRQLANKLQCDQCNKVFVWPKDLTRHKRIHMPDDEKFECPYCERKFYRKDHLQTHLKVHGVAGNMAAATTTAAATKRELNRKVNAVDPHLCKPNGLKCVQCKICLSKHTKIADLRAHLMDHRTDVSLSQHVTTNSEISLLFYPDEAPMSRELLIARMLADLTAGQLDRFYSITNELGHELSISGSDTDDTDSDSEPDETLDHAIGYSIRHPRRSTYNCDLCSIAFTRKYKLFAHQASAHRWDEAPYVCQHCQAHFLCDKLLQSHYRHQCKNLLKRYVCRKCPQRFMWKENLKMHLRTMHPDSEDVKKIFSLSSYDCEECSRSFQMQKDLTRHMMTHRTDATVFPCLWCPRKFYRRSNLYLHIKRHGITSHQLSAAAAHITACKGRNGKKEIHCRVCNMQFNSISALRTHLRQETSAILPTHHNYDALQNYSIMNELGFELDMNDSETEGEDDEDKPAKSYKCQMCGLVCKRRYEMGQHQLSVHKHEHITLKCDKCVFRTVSSDIMDHHMRTQCNNAEKLHQCTQCSYKFMWPENLEIHIKLVHPPEETQTASDTLADLNPTATDDVSARSITVPLQTFQCDKCERRYNRKDRLMAHMKKLHGQSVGDPSCSTSVVEAKPPTVGGKRPPKEKKFLCAFCGRAVSSSSNLIVHMRRHTGEKPFQCDYCDKAFPRSSDLACHRRTHTGEKPHRCTVCDKSFSRSYKLHTHMRIHSGERPYKCTFCEKSFAQSNDLALHVRRHTGERPYVCNVCGEDFIQGTALKNHRAALGHFVGDAAEEDEASNVLQLDEEGNSLMQL